MSNSRQANYRRKKMFRRNERFQNDSEDQSNPQTNRDFTRILRAANPFWDLFLEDKEKHTARGLLAAKNGNAYTADLSFNDRRSRIQLLITLRTKGILSTSQLRSLLKLQGRIDGLSSIVIDEESCLLQIRSHAVLPDSNAAKKVVSEIVRDALIVLDDSTLRDFTN
jgi:hypothetical protein